MKFDPKMRDRIRARLPQVVTDLRALAHDHAPQAASAREAGYTIKDADTDQAVVRIYDEIWWLGVNAEDLAADLDRITSARILVEINSPGGDVFDGIAIYNALRNHPAEVTTRIDGIAASIASVIFQAGDRRIVQPAGQMMIHNAWGYTVGDRRDHADMSEILEQQDRIIAGIYARHSNGDADHFRELMDAETWMDADTIIAEGLADEIVDAGAGTSNAQRRTLYDQIAEAVDAASRVDALREEAGKGLSNRNRECLEGLRDRLTALLDEQPDPTPSTPDAPAPSQELVELRARLYSRQAARPRPTLEV